MRCLVRHYRVFVDRGNSARDALSTTPTELHIASSDRTIRDISIQLLSPACCALSLAPACSLVINTQQIHSQRLAAYYAFSRDSRFMDRAR